jgi:DNA-binding response OmpR family regulator
LKVLVVDDDRDFCEAAAMALAAEGIDAEAVFDGDAALDQLASGRFDAAIVDVRMPGKWGVDVVREWRASHGPSLPILMATGEERATGLCAGLMAGADEELFKSEADGEMVRKLRRLWKSRAH